MKKVTVEVTGVAPTDDAILLFPRPFGHWGQGFERLSLAHDQTPVDLHAKNSAQRACAIKPVKGAPIEIGYEFAARDDGVPPTFWAVQDNRYTRADESLVGLAGELTESASSQQDKLWALIQYAAEMFGYEHSDERFYDRREAVPAVCGTTKGDCVDINTFLLAAARSQGICGQYIAGYWFHPDKTETHSMHCWLVFEPDGQRVYWDLAHHLKWGVETLGPGLNPAGGRRVAMSCGRGLIFDTENGRVEISHFSEPVWVMPGGGIVKPAIVARVTD